MKPLFGPAGNSLSFAAQGHKKNSEIPLYLTELGLNCFEYQCGRGVRVSESSVLEFTSNAKELGIAVSLHAPYFISMSGMVEETRLNSVRYFKESAAAIALLGGNRVIFHSGSCGKQSREAALELAIDTMKRVVTELDKDGFSDVILCPETMGKVNQLGTLDEVLALCKVDKRITPCIDFGHLNARGGGCIKTKGDYAAILERMAELLQDERASNFHVHFSKIEYTVGGEKRHLTFEDAVFGPQYEPLIELIYERGLSPTIICESDGTQAEDAAVMKKYFENIGAKK